jgi:hypothetical protein
VGSYIVTTIVAAMILVAGILVWMKLVPPASVFGAIVVSQLTLLLLLIPRFWQRGVAVSYYLQSMVQPVAVQSFAPAPVIAESVIAPAVADPAAPSIIPIPPPEPQQS